MSEQSSDRNLLLGILALQLDFIQQHQLIAAMQQWLLHKSTKLEDILLRQDAIDEEKRDFLVSIVQKHLQFHDDDPKESLASLSSLSSVKKELDKLADPDLHATLAGVSANWQGDKSADATQSMVSDGMSQFGRYRILRPHDAGGLGRVSVAEDEELHREVALKEIKERYANDPGSRHRFLVEAEVTGRLEHPGIVPVYGLGQDSHGRPFYAMRFIRGDSLKSRIKLFYSSSEGPRTSKTRNLELRKLLQRFTDVCNAIEYAHSRGVLHRDLKPGNIMLGKYGETLVVDWGLAKTVEKTGTHEQSDEPTFFPSSGDDSSKTRMGSIIGTPKFMSPEQAEGRIDQMGPRTDVYCLGSTLYCILTGQPPFTGNNASEILSAVRKGDFRAPSSVRSDVPRALEAICLKAMALKPSDRYETAAALAEEIDLWLADEPVSVYREPWADRVGRFLRKHRTLVASGAVLLVTVVLALAVINALVTKQNRELRIARDQAEANRRRAVKEEEKARQHLATARSIALNIVEIAEQRLSRVPGQEGFRETMMDRVHQMLQDIYRDEPETPGVRLELAEAARLSGNLKRVLKKSEEAAERLSQSIELQQQLRQRDPDTTERLAYLAETLRDQSTLLKDLGRMDDADAALQSATQIMVPLARESPDNLDYQRILGTIDLEGISLQIDRLKLDAALQLSIRCADTYKLLSESDNRAPLDHLMMMLAMARHGQLLDRLDRGDEARAVFAEAIESGRQWVEKTPDRNTRYAFARLLHWAAEGAIQSGTVTDDARSQLDEALRLWDILVEGSSGYAGFQYYLGEAWRLRAKMYALENQPDEAITAFERSREVLEASLEKVTDADHQDALAQTLTDFAEFKRATEADAEAAGLLERALSLRQQACKLSPASEDLRQKLQKLQQTVQATRSPE